MYYRTNDRLGNGVVRIMSWVMRVKTPAVKLSHLLAAIWLSFLFFYQAPTAVHMACRALSSVKPVGCTHRHVGHPLLLVSLALGVFRLLETP